MWVGPGKKRSGRSASGGAHLRVAETISPDIEQLLMMLRRGSLEDRLSVIQDLEKCIRWRLPPEQPPTLLIDWIVALRAIGLRQLEARAISCGAGSDFKLSGAAGSARHDDLLQSTADSIIQRLVGATAAEFVERAPGAGLVQEVVSKLAELQSLALASDTPAATELQACVQADGQAAQLLAEVRSELGTGDSCGQDDDDGQSDGLEGMVQMVLQSKLASKIGLAVRKTLEVLIVSDE